MELSDLIIREVVAVNRVNRATGTYAVHRRPYCALCCKITGRSTYIQDGMVFPSDSGHIVYIPSGATYRYSCLEEGECVIVEFQTEEPGEVLQSFAVTNGPEILATLEKIERAHTFRKTGSRVYCLSGLYRLLYGMVSQNESRYLSNLKKSRIQSGLDYLECHYQDSALSAQILAEQSGVSEIYFRKLFAEIYGMPPKKYINLIRMTKAKELLLTGEITVAQVADAVGFRDVYSFCKAFRKAHDCTPTEYRKTHWN